MKDFIIHGVIIPKFTQSVRDEIINSGHTLEEAATDIFNFAQYGRLKDFFLDGYEITNRVVIIEPKFKVLIGVLVNPTKKIYTKVNIRKKAK